MQILINVSFPHIYVQFKGENSTHYSVVQHNYPFPAKASQIGLL